MYLHDMYHLIGITLCGHFNIGLKVAHFHDFNENYSVINYTLIFVYIIGLQCLEIYHNNK